MKTFTHKPYKRPNRVGEEMRHFLGNLFISEIFIPEAGLLTVTKVKVTDDEVQTVLGKPQFDKEEDIFKFIGMKYVEHHMRNKTTLSKVNK